MNSYITRFILITIILATGIGLSQSKLSDSEIKAKIAEKDAKRAEFVANTLPQAKTLTEPNGQKIESVIISR